ncbi:MAG: LysR substrate-binding domain-containing protein [Telluria sp.]
MDRLRAMHYFIRAVELGSLSAAARELGTTQPTVSKVLGALERELGVRLMERSTTGLSLTSQGTQFYDRAKSVVEEFNEAVSEARGLTEQATGLLRINAPVALGQFRLNGLVQEFLGLYPKIAIELILNDRYIDLVEEGVDVALRIGRNLPQNAIARSVAVSPRLLVAAPSYLHKHQAPEHPTQLGQHDYVRFAWLPTGDEVELHNGEERVLVTTQGRYRVNNAISIRETLAMGAGIGLCPAWLVDDLLASGQLLRVLPDWSGISQELFMIYPSRRYQPLRAKLFMDFIATKVPGLAGFS